MSKNASAAVGSASDPICFLDDDDDEPSTVAKAVTKKEESPVSESADERKMAAMTNGTKKRQHNPYIKSDQRGTKRQRPQTAASISPTSHQVPIKIFTTRMDEQNRRAFGDESFRSTHATLREMLGFDNATEHRQMRWFIASNYLVDFDYLMNTVPELLSCPYTVVFYGSAQGTSPEPWKLACTQPDGTCTAHFVRLDPTEPARSKANPLPIKIPYAVHHTKMFLIGYDTGIRVIIHTANLLQGDVHYKTQAAYIQDFPFKPDKAMEPSCQFENDLVSYMGTYGYRDGYRWDGETFTSLTRALRRYDFSSARVVLIPSIPGEHSLSRAPLGLLKLRDAIREHASSSGASSGPVVCQFSSMGSLSAKWLNEQFLSSTTLVGSSSQMSNRPLSKRLKFVYPTVREICTSVEGPSGGGSVPGTKRNVEKDWLMPLYCKWSSTRTNNPFQQNRNVPHIKSYYQLSDDNASMKWFVLGSQNMSKAAWGEQRNSSQYGRVNAIRHWELGVFFSPELMGAGPEGRFVPFGLEDNTGSAIRIPLPYAMLPDPYGSDDRPWVVDGDPQSLVGGANSGDAAGSGGMMMLPGSIVQQIDPAMAAGGECVIH
jgi:tyrosyl-DNA phosphodiesterase-1